MAESPKAAVPSNALRITVRILNIAEVPPETLAQAGEVITEIFSQAGIEVIWLDCSASDEDPQSACSQPLAPTHFLVKLIADSKALLVGRQSSCCGFALRSEEGESSNYAYIFYDCLRKIVSQARPARGRILGYVVTHEIGHLLLPSGKHSRTGIMGARLKMTEWQRASYGDLWVFTRRQAEQLRAGVQARLRQQEAAQTSRLASAK